MVIIFSNEKARNQLLNEGVVYTFRKNRRKQFEKMPEHRQRQGFAVTDWATDKRMGKKITNVIINEYGPHRLEEPGPYSLDDLAPYTQWSGFNSLEEWKEAILEFSPGLENGWLYKVTVYPKTRSSKYPDNCTLCDTPFDEAKKSKDGKRMIFPYPPNHYLCWDCFTKSMDTGLGRLNKKLAEGNLDLSVEEIADTIKPESRASQQLRKTSVLRGESAEPHDIGEADNKQGERKKE